MLTFTITIQFVTAFLCLSPFFLLQVGLFCCFFFVVVSFTIETTFVCVMCRAPTSACVPVGHHWLTLIQRSTQDNQWQSSGTPSRRPPFFFLFSSLFNIIQADRSEHQTPFHAYQYIRSGIQSIKAVLNIHSLWPIPSTVSFRLCIY